jgi:hypothetical protein
LRSDVEEAALNAALPLFQEHPGSAPLFVRWGAPPDVTESPGEKGNGVQPGEADALGEGSDATSQANGSGAPDRKSVSARLRSRSITVTPSESLLRDLRQLFGNDRIRLVRT